MYRKLCMLRKISIIFASAFLILIALINSCPVVTQWDRSFIIFMQERLAGLPLWIPMLPDCVLYTAMIILPLLSGAIFFIKKRKVADFNLLFINSACNIFTELSFKASDSSATTAYGASNYINPS